MNPNFEKKQEALKLLQEYTQRLMKGKEHVEYAELQLTWNAKILEESMDFVIPDAQNAIGIGSFQGALEMAISHFHKNVDCVDHQDFLPKWKPSNVRFHKANIDSGKWKLPDKRYDICYFVEVVEHLLWSPLPLLKWMHEHCNVLVISTPDNAEWPAVEINPWTRYQHFAAIPAAVPGVKSNPNPMFHCKQYDQDELIEMITFAGFRLNKFFRVGDGLHQMTAICTPR